MQTPGEILAHIAGIDDFEVAEAAYRAALKRWPNARVILPEGGSFNAHPRAASARLHAVVVIPMAAKDCFARGSQ